IWVADADGANPREVAPKRGGFHKHWVAWSRDGKYIYFNYTVSTTNTEPSSLYRVPAAGGPIEPAIETVRRAVFPALTPAGARRTERSCMRQIPRASISVSGGSPSTAGSHRAS